MEERVLEYSNRRWRNWRSWRRIALVLGSLLLVIYVGGYVRMREQHDFVRNGTGYTGADGRWVRTDYVDLGDGRWGWKYTGLYILYWPMLSAEGMAWRCFGER